MAVASLDVSKAYDSVWHRGLLHQCREVLSEPSSRWIAAFLYDRRASALEGGVLSVAFPVPGGVPQGSPLSPLLYVLYTRTMPLPRGRRLGATAYADDIAIFAPERSPAAAWRVLEPHLDALAAWGRRWRLRFSAEKTQAANFSRRRGGWTSDQLGSPSFGETPLPWRASIDLLGVRLDRRLSLLRHARWVDQRTAPRILDLRRLLESQRTVPAWVGLLLYRSLVRPCLTYAAPVLPLACDSGWEQLERTERRGLRAALRLWPDSDLATLHRRTTALGRFREEVRRLARRFLLRHTTRDNVRLLSTFAPEVDQRSDRIHHDGPLERMLAWLPPPDRRRVVLRVRASVPAPSHQLPGCGSRATLQPLPQWAWGVSPFGPGRGGLPSDSH